MAETSWKVEYKRELDRARRARAKGNEGMARVCARRSAAIVIGEYLHQHGYHQLKASLYDRLSILNGLPGVDEQVKNVCGHFVMKVDSGHKLPAEVDLMQDVIWLENSLLGQ
jgi:hypothetical protein